MCGNLWWIPPEKECDRDKKCVKKMPFTKHGGQGNEMTNTQVQDAATAPFRTLWGTARGKPLGLISPWFWSKNQGENSPDLGSGKGALGCRCTGRRCNSAPHRRRGASARPPTPLWPPDQDRRWLRPRETDEGLDSAANGADGGQHEGSRHRDLQPRRPELQPTM